MSKRKDIKIKFLKRKSLWPKIVGMIISDGILLTCAVVLIYVAMLGLIKTAVIENYNDCSKVIQIVNDEWSESPSETFTQHINNFIEYLSTIDEVYIINKDFEVINAFGESNPDFEKIFYKNKKKGLGDNKKITRSDYSIGDDEWLLQIDSSEVDNNMLKNTLNFGSFDTNLAALEAHRKPYKVIENWAAYTTNNPDIFVCIKSSLVVTQFHVNVILIADLVFVCIILFCTIYGIIRLVNVIASAKKINALISTDSITGGKNKDWFIDKARRLIKNRKTSYAILKIRLEKYRNFCISYGVKQGENLLEQISVKLEHIISKKEIAAHIENSDFGLMLIYTDEESINKRIQNIVESLKTVNTKQHLSFIAGAKKIENKNEDISSLLSDVSLALRALDGKSSGISWFTAAMTEDQIWERRIENDMERALENHEFQLFLQPKYSTKGEKLAAAEALVRWIHPELGFISPGKFIPLFETNGFILKLDDYMLNAVAMRQAAWMKQGKQLVPISVNVSRAHFTEEDLAEHICQIVDEYKVPHEFIELELTESAFFDDKAILLNTVKKLKDYGFMVSMDDFGAGYSSLNSLKELPLDIIKLDAEFFRNINDIDRANLIVGDTITLAKKLGMKIVAEGIETREQVDFLANQDCDLIQGFYFAKPLPVNEFEKRAYPEA